ncbi:MAG: hypothetical protein M1812_002846 [Candelaria pacifica]|nr:MAG: hypothetical protein M1812_002846 [Candelaria pacifica]
MASKLAIHPRAQEMLKQIRMQELLKEALDSGLIIDSDCSRGHEIKAGEESLADDDASRAPTHWGKSTGDPQNSGRDLFVAPESGSFKTYYNPGNTNSKVVNLGSPKVAFGLTLLDMHSELNHSNLKFKIFVDEVVANSFKIHFNDLNTKSLLHQGEASWLRVLHQDRLLQLGHYSTKEDHFKAGLPNLTRKIVFDWPYSEVPKVIVWLCGVDLFRGHSKDFRIKAEAVDITRTDFMINFDPIQSSEIWSADACWIAHPIDLPGVASGTFDNLKASPADPTVVNDIVFPHPFDQPPRVIACINRLEFSCGSNVRLQVVTEATSVGLAWYLNTWDDSIMYGAGAAYIAIDQVRWQPFPK